MQKSPLTVWASPAFKDKQANPYTSTLYEQLSTLGADVQEFDPALMDKRPAPDILHLHFPQYVLRFSNTLKTLKKLVRFLLRLRRIRRRGTRVVWTVHDLHHHEHRHPLLDWIFRRLFPASIDACIHLSESGRTNALEVLPGLARIPDVIIPHPHYRGLYPDHVDRRQARQVLGLESEAKVAVFLGQIRPYKNVPGLIWAFRAISDPDARLVIAGWPRDEQLNRDIHSLVGEDDRIHLHATFVPDERIQYYLRASDIMVAPYRNIQNSGSALLALSFDRPILVPSKGAMPELQATVGKQWVNLYPDEIQTEVLKPAIDASHNQPPGRPNLDIYNHDSFAQATLDAYQGFLRED